MISLDCVLMFWVVVDQVMFLCMNVKELMIKCGYNLGSIVMGIIVFLGIKYQESVQMFLEIK